MVVDARSRDMDMAVVVEMVAGAGNCKVVVVGIVLGEERRRMARNLRRRLPWAVALGGGIACHKLQDGPCVRGKRRLGRLGGSADACVGSRLGGYQGRQHGKLV